jgi:hypothetical protein
MCLIAYVPAGKSLPLDNMRAAHFANDDGIGIMSREGICKFLGKKALKKAIKTVAKLEEAKIEYAIHFRYKTHGDVILQNCHPFKTADGRAYVMHNGVLSDYTSKATKDCSDTGAFVNEYLTDVPEDNNMDYWCGVARHIGWNNKLCIMTHDFKFILVHGEAGTYRDGIWYSQTYSLPSTTPKVWYGESTGYYPRRDYHTPVERNRHWPYHVLDCSCVTCTTERARDKTADGRRDDVGDSRSWVNRDSTWYDKVRERQRTQDDKDKVPTNAHERVPTSIVSESLRKALDRRYGEGIPDPRTLAGRRTARQPLRLTHNRTPTPTPLQVLAGALPGVDSGVRLNDTDDTTADDTTDQTRKDQDEQLDAALRAHLIRVDDDGGYAEAEIDVTGNSASQHSLREDASRGDLLPGWSELNTGTLDG